MMLGPGNMMCLVLRLGCDAWFLDWYVIFGPGNVI